MRRKLGGEIKEIRMGKVAWEVGIWEMREGNVEGKS